MPRPNNTNTVYTAEASKDAARKVVYSPRTLQRRKIIGYGKMPHTDWDGNIIRDKSGNIVYKKMKTDSMGNPIYDVYGNIAYHPYIEGEAGDAATPVATLAPAPTRAAPVTTLAPAPTRAAPVTTLAPTAPVQAQRPVITAIEVKPKCADILGIKKMMQSLRDNGYIRS